jgi:ubiquinone/menaquinone biosynthesis C-methylase UbiE
MHADRRLGRDWWRHIGLRLPAQGVSEFPDAQDFAGEIAAQGFVNITYERLSLGIVAIHVARKPWSV